MGCAALCSLDLEAAGDHPATSRHVLPQVEREVRALGRAGRRRSPTPSFARQAALQPDAQALSLPRAEASSRPGLRAFAGDAEGLPGSGRRSFASSSLCRPSAITSTTCVTGRKASIPLIFGRCTNRCWMLSPPIVPSGHYYRFHPNREDGGYLEALVDTCRRSFRISRFQGVEKPVQRFIGLYVDMQVGKHIPPKSGS